MTKTQSKAIKNNEIACMSGELYEGGYHENDSG